MAKRYPQAIEHLSRSLQILIKTFVGRLDSGKNCLILIAGQTGSGKSWGACSIIYHCFLYMEGREPTVEEMEYCWSFKAKEFVKKMNQDGLELKGLNLWDEMGVSASAKTHQSVQNRVISYLVQTFRNLQQLVIFTVPMSSFIDKSVRNLLHYHLEARKILKKDKLCIVKPLELQYNLRMEKMFYHNLLWPAEDDPSLLDEVDEVGLPSPPKPIVEAYERIAKEFKKQLTKELEVMLDRMDEEDQKKNLSGTELVISKCTVLQKQVMKLYQSGITSTNEIAKRMNTKAQNISCIKASIRNKGINIEELPREIENKAIMTKLNGETI